MILVRVDVHEVDTRTVRVHTREKELEVILGVGERLECCPIANGHGAVGEIDRYAGVHRVLAGRVSKLGDVVDTVAVNIGRVGDEVLLHFVPVRGQCPHVLGKRRRAVFTQRHGDP